MSEHGAASRRHVVYGGRKIRGLKVRTLKDGTDVYEGRLQIGGVDRTIALEAKTPTDAVREYEGLKVDRDRGVERENPLVNSTIGEVAAEWLAHCEARVGLADPRRRYARNTVSLRERAVRLWVLPSLGANRPANNVKAADARRMIDALSDRGLAPSSQTAALSILSLLMGYAVKRGYAPANPVRDLTRDERPGNKRRKEPRYLGQDELARLLDAADPPWRTLIAVMLYAGLRISEALGLRWRDVDFANARLTVDGQYDQNIRDYAPAKTESSHASLPLFPALARELSAHRSRQAETGIALIGGDRYVFTRAATGRPWSSQYSRRKIHATALRAGLDDDAVLKRVAPHDLRHSYVAQALESGATVPQVTKAARHANSAITMRSYAGLTEDGRDQAAARMLEAGFGA